MLRVFFRKRDALSFFRGEHIRAHAIGISGINRSLRVRNHKFKAVIRSGSQKFDKYAGRFRRVDSVAESDRQLRIEPGLSRHAFLDSHVNGLIHIRFHVQRREHAVLVECGLVYFVARILVPIGIGNFRRFISERDRRIYGREISRQRKVRTYVIEIGNNGRFYIVRIFSRRLVEFNPQRFGIFQRDSFFIDVIYRELCVRTGNFPVGNYIGIAFVARLRYYRHSAV